MTYYERNLPHWQPEGKLLFVTWRLRGTLPATRWARIKAQVERRALERAAPGAEKARGQECPRHLRPSPGQYFRALDAELDGAQTGAAWLREPAVAQAVVSAVRRGEQLGHYRLHGFVVMPNHVHILMEPNGNVVRLLKALKGSSARNANRLLPRTGQPFWQDESFDHWVRNDAEFERIHRYIEQNPVKAGLVRRAEDWAWSSAARRTSQP